MLDSGRFPLANTLAGPVIGFTDTHRLSQHSQAWAKENGDHTPIRKWLGVPYAQARRWERPTNPAPWSHPKDCFEFGPIFPQSSNPFDLLYNGKEGWLTREFLGQSEDAFTANVFAPPASAGTALPVLVWFYGGNLNSGGSNFPVYDPTEFVRQQYRLGLPCIVVTGNYRVGIFGWLSTEDLAETNGHVGNFGLHDCIKLLEWTRANIASFGGNPENVTAMGESAGAFIIGTLIHSGRELYQKAILQSGSHAAMTFRQRPSYPPYEGLVGILGIEDGLDSKSRVETMRSVSMERLRDAAAQVFVPDVWGVTADPSEPGWATSVWNQLEKGEYDPWITSVLVSINKDEGTFFSNRGKWWEEGKLLHVLKARGVFPEGKLDDFARLYPNTEVRDDMSNLADVAATMFLYDTAFIVPLHQLAKTLPEVPNKYTGKRAKLFVCQFEYIPSKLLEGLEHLGVLHTGEIPLIFNSASLWSYNEESIDAKTAMAVGRCWSSFAYAGSPGWSECEGSRGEAVAICEGGFLHGFNIYETRKAQSDFWYPIVKSNYSS